jgi:hypothetical protein
MFQTQFSVLDCGSAVLLRQKLNSPGEQLLYFWEIFWNFQKIILGKRKHLHGVRKSNFILGRNKMCAVGSQSIIPPLLSMNNAYSTWSFITGDSSVVPDTLIDLMFNLNKYYIWWAHRTSIINNTRPPSFKYSYIFTKFTVDDMVAAILNCQYSKHFMRYYII